jgi:hypothetical protein
MVVVVSSLALLCLAAPAIKCRTDGVPLKPPRDVMAVNLVGGTPDVPDDECSELIVLKLALAMEADSAVVGRVPPADGTEEGCRLWVLCSELPSLQATLPSVAQIDS